MAHAAHRIDSRLRGNDNIGLHRPSIQVEPLMLSRLLQWAKKLKAEVVTLWFCYRHPQTPLIAKILAIAVVAYAFSPIDLIPDFIPVVGLLDDAILLPLGIWLTLKFIPKPVLDECREQAARWLADKPDKPRNWFGAAMVIALWIAAVWLCWHWVFR